tara:strand:- start:11870 stop:12685 length:816 start_codon:yes stop_codon:yes gene_type:complete
MYNYIFGGNLKKNPKSFILFVKRLMPRWVNSIPDSECLAIFEILNKMRLKKKKPLVLVETGCGSSTVAMIVHCCIYGGKVFSWDINQSRGSFLRNLFSETIGLHYKKDINKIWNFIGFDSVDKNIGIAVLKELKQKADFGFFDSLHTTNHVKKELNEFLKISSSSFIAAFDDAYIDKKHTNTGYINVMRMKLNLKKIEDPKNNKSETIWKEAYKLLKKNYKKVKKINTTFNKNSKKDIYFDYFSPDRNIGLKAEMENDSKRAETFVAYKVN